MIERHTNTHAHAVVQTILRACGTKVDEQDRAHTIVILYNVCWKWLNSIFFTSYRLAIIQTQYALACYYTFSSTQAGYSLTASCFHSFDAFLSLRLCVCACVFVYYGSNWTIVHICTIWICLRCRRPRWRRRWSFLSFRVNTLPSNWIY